MFWLYNGRPGPWNGVQKGEGSGFLVDGTAVLYEACGNVVFCV